MSSTQPSLFNGPFFTGSRCCVVAREISVVDRKIPDPTPDEKAKDKAIMDDFKASGNIK
jgi:hypothetical protein